MNLTRSDMSRPVLMAAIGLYVTSFGFNPRVANAAPVKRALSPSQQVKIEVLDLNQKAYPNVMQCIMALGEPNRPSHLNLNQGKNRYNITVGHREPQEKATILTLNLKQTDHGRRYHKRGDRKGGEPQTMSLTFSGRVEKGVPTILGEVKQRQGGKWRVLVTLL